MSTTYPTTYRGNTIYDEARVRDLPDYLLLVSDNTEEIDYILENIGVEHDRSSIVLEDSYNTLFVETGEGEYVEVWGVHRSVAYLNDWAVRLL